MILKIENLEINLKSVIKTLVWTSIGFSICEAILAPKRYVTYVVLDNQEKDTKVSRKKSKVESI